MMMKKKKISMIEEIGEVREQERGVRLCKSSNDTRIATDTQTKPKPNKVDKVLKKTSLLNLYQKQNLWTVFNILTDGICHIDMAVNF